MASPAGPGLLTSTAFPRLSTLASSTTFRKWSSSDQQALFRKSETRLLHTHTSLWNARVLTMAAARERARRVAEVKELLGDDLRQVLAVEGAESFFVDSNIRRYLEANDNDVVTAAALLQAAMVWREERDVHKVRARLVAVCATGRQPALSDLAHYESVCAEFMVGALTVFSKAKRGDLFSTNLLGRSDPLAGIRSVSGDIFDVFWIEWLESLNVQLTQLQHERDVAASSMAASAASSSGSRGGSGGAGPGGPPATTQTCTTTAATLSRLHLLLDFRDLGTAHLGGTCMSFFLQHIARGAWKCYPECIGSMYCTSTNWIFQGTLALIRPFAPQKVKFKCAERSAARRSPLSRHGARLCSP